jgi:hypothetical protein
MATEISRGERIGRAAVLSDFVGNGSKNGTKRIKCKLCQSSLNFDRWEAH